MNVTDNMELSFFFLPLTYLKCSLPREVAYLPLCEFRFDRNETEQCAVGRTGNVMLYTHTHMRAHTHSFLSPLQARSVEHVPKATACPWTFSTAWNKATHGLVSSSTLVFVSEPGQTHTRANAHAVHTHLKIASSIAGVVAVFGCIAILYFNIGVPNELRGFFFFTQVSTTVM